MLWLVQPHVANCHLSVVAFLQYLRIIKVNWPLLGGAGARKQRFLFPSVVSTREPIIQRGIMEQGVSEIMCFIVSRCDCQSEL